MTASPAPSPAPQAASSGSPVRLIILIVLLLVVVGTFAYDRMVAEPSSEAAYVKLEDFVTAQNAKGVKEATLVRSEDVQAAIGQAPTFTEKKPDYTVEYYCWFGQVPVLNTWKRYLAVVYVGDEPRRYDAHYKNQRPPADSLPGYVDPNPPPAGAVEETGMGGEGGMGAGGAPGGPPPEGGEGGGKKKGGKKKGGDAPAEETAAPEPTAPPAEAPAEPAPVEPAPTEPVVEEKPAEPEAAGEAKPE
jgi:hypothetical protein